MAKPLSSYLWSSPAPPRSPQTCGLLAVNEGSARPRCAASPGVAGEASERFPRHARAHRVARLRLGFPRWRGDRAPDARSGGEVHGADPRRSLGSWVVHHLPTRHAETYAFSSMSGIRIEWVEILTCANRRDSQSEYTVAVETLSRRAASLTVSSESAPTVTFSCITGALNDRRKSTKPGEGTESASPETSPNCEDLPDPASLDSQCGRDWGASGRWFKSSRPDSVAPVIPQESRGFLFILSPAIFTTAGIALRVPPPQVTSQVTFRGPRSARRRAAPRGQGDVRPSFLTPHLGPSRPPMARTVGEGRASLVTPPRTAMPSAG